MSDGKTETAQNRLAPKHEILSKDEEQKVLAQLGISRHGLPRIYETDPQVLAIKAKAGQVLKIMRAGNYETGPNAYYRIVVKKQAK